MEAFKKTAEGAPIDSSRLEDAKKVLVYNADNQSEEEWFRMVDCACPLPILGFTHCNGMAICNLLPCKTEWNAGRGCDLCMHRPIAWTHTSVTQPSL